LRTVGLLIGDARSGLVKDMAAWISSWTCHDFMIVVP